MEYAHVILASLFSILALFLITKLLGCRQINQLSMFDYINGITIGSIAAELAASWGKEFWQWAIALVIYGLATFLLSLATDRSIQARRLITGTPIPLYENGQLLDLVEYPLLTADQNFRRAKLDLNEFLMQCRLAGYFDLSQLEAVLFEPNGMLSILPASPYRPATPFDLERAVEQSTLLVNVILDGKVMEENLTGTGKDRPWLEHILAAQGCQAADVFLALYDPTTEAVQVYRRSGGKEEDKLE